MSQLRFRDRVDAGRRLAAQLAEYRGKQAVVLAIPRGGVVVGFEVARALGASLDVIVPRKIGAPGNPELAIGAVTEDGTAILNQALVEQLGVTPEFVEAEKAEQIVEIKRRVSAYRGGLPPVELRGKTVVLVDDGVATGATMRAAVYSVKRQGASEVVVAVPVGPPDTIALLRGEVGRVVCPVVYEPFYAIGQFYDDFEQTSDEEVVKLLRESGKPQPAA